MDTLLQLNTMCINISSGFPKLRPCQGSLLGILYITLFHFVREKKFKTTADFACDQTLSDVKDIYAKFTEDWIIEVSHFGYFSKNRQSIRFSYFSYFYWEN